jgi:4-hydroxy-tetrahydrodipicolinate synthase
MFSGSFVALITPFNQGQLDEAALRKLVDYQIENGTAGLVAVGTSGESCTLTNAEHKQVVEIVIEQSADRVPVIVGAGSNNPTEALEYAQFAEQAGADGLLCVAGYYNRPSQEGLYQHFKLIHDNTCLPIIIYNIPPRAIVDVLPETMQRLSMLERIVGVKDSTADLNRINLEQQIIDQPFSYFSGEDMTAIAYRALGGNGCISVVANVAPEQCAQMHLACDSGDFTRARQIHRDLLQLNKALFREPSPAGIKYAASMMGICSEQARLPIVSLNKSSKALIENALLNLSLI